MITKILYLIVRFSSLLIRCLAHETAEEENSYALESDEWQNGVFTYSILSGLKNYAADQNGDQQITVSELKSYVSDKVVELTNGAQKPTSRQENVEFDFRVW